MHRYKQSSQRSSQVIKSVVVSLGGMPLILILLCINVSCNSRLNWSLHGLKCEDPSLLCETGYSCLVDECVENSSIALGGTCSSSQQCGSGRICMTNPSICAASCVSLDSFNDNQCSAIDNSFCARVHDPEGVVSGACVSVDVTEDNLFSSCSTDDDCNDETLSCNYLASNSSGSTNNNTSATGVCLYKCALEISAGHGCRNEVISNGVHSFQTACVQDQSEPSSSLSSMYCTAVNEPPSLGEGENCSTSNSSGNFMCSTGLVCARDPNPSNSALPPECRLLCDSSADCNGTDSCYQVYSDGVGYCAP